MEKYLNGNKVFLIILICGILTIVLPSNAFSNDDNELYQIGINYILTDFTKQFGMHYATNFYIVESFVDSNLHKDLLESQSKFIAKYSKNLANNFKNSTEFEHKITNNININARSEYLPDSIAKKYFYPNAKDVYEKFYKDFEEGALIGLPKIIYNNSRNKAAFLLYFFNGNSPGSMINLIILEKKKNKWYVKKTKFVAWLS